MAGNSTFPAVLDTDSNLYRVTPGDPQTVSQHNNHTDALESVETVIGVVDDGSGSGAPTYNTGLAHVIPLFTTSQPNPLYHWSPDHALTFRGGDGALPAGWTLGAGVTASWVNPRGWLRLTVPAAGPQWLLTCDLGGTVPWWFFISLCGSTLDDPRLNVGFSIIGDGTDLDGAGFYNVLTRGCFARQVIAGTRQTGGSVVGLSGERTQACWIHDGTDQTVRDSGNGVIWGSPTYAPPDRGNPTKFGFYSYQAPANQYYLWISQIQAGEATPPDWTM